MATTERGLRGSVLRRLVPRDDLPHPYRVPEEVLGESTGTLGGDSLREANGGGVEQVCPQSATYANWDRAPLSLAAQKARVTLNMGRGITDAMNGYRVRSEWGRTQVMRALLDAARLR